MFSSTGSAPACVRAMSFNATKNSSCDSCPLGSLLSAFSQMTDRAWSSSPEARRNTTASPGPKLSLSPDARRHRAEYTSSCPAGTTLPPTAAAAAAADASVAWTSCVCGVSRGRGEGVCTSAMVTASAPCCMRAISLSATKTSAFESWPLGSRTSEASHTAPSASLSSPDDCKNAAPTAGPTSSASVSPLTMRSHSLSYTARSAGERYSSGEGTSAAGGAVVAIDGAGAATGGALSSGAGGVAKGSSTGSFWGTAAGTGAASPPLPLLTLRGGVPPSRSDGGTMFGANFLGTSTPLTFSLMIHMASANCSAFSSPFAFVSTKFHTCARTSFESLELRKIPMTSAPLTSPSLSRSTPLKKLLYVARSALDTTHSTPAAFFLSSTGAGGRNSAWTTSVCPRSCGIFAGALSASMLNFPVDCVSAMSLRATKNYAWWE
eukprot:m.1039978 g.1039978  ORF g.1039978 m.1039978 type:complete len:435 (-) comp24152_c0_seq3:108-1412(-)